MTRFEWYDKGYGQMAFHLGIINDAQFQQFIDYKVYLKNRVGRSQTKAIELTAEETGSNVPKVYRAMRFFEAKIAVPFS
jgi:hypothetical protein